MLISDKTYQQSLDEAGRIAHYDPDEADAVKAIQRTSAPVLIMHGTNDWVVPHQQSERLHAAALDHSELVLVPYLDTWPCGSIRAGTWPSGPAIGLTVGRRRRDAVVSTADSPNHPNQETCTDGGFLVQESCEGDMGDGAAIQLSPSDSPGMTRIPADKSRGSDRRSK